jgi:hypothetical protein
MSTSQHQTLPMLVGAAVSFMDADGESWRVTERDCRDVPGARGTRCLIFMSESVFRRVWLYPAEWRALSAIALEALSWRR